MIDGLLADLLVHFGGVLTNNIMCTERQVAWHRLGLAMDGEDASTDRTMFGGGSFKGPSFVSNARQPKA